jgi:nitroreductase
MDPYQTILSRRSIRRYKPDPVPHELVLKVLEAGRLAPTARNEQPWQFVVITDAQRRRELADLTDYGKFIADAPVCIVVLCKPTKYYLEDGSAAITQMMLAATALGLGSCWVAGDKKTYAGHIVQFCAAPAHYKLVALMALGYPAETPTPQKRPLDEIVRWDSPARTS